MTTETELKVQLVGADTYSTLTKAYQRGQVYVVTQTVWEGEPQGTGLRYKRNPGTNQSLFAECDDAGAIISQPKEVSKAAVGGPSDGPKTGKITITHSQPHRDENVSYGDDDLKEDETGERTANTEIDTGSEVDLSAIVGDGEGGDGHEGLDDDAPAEGGEGGEGSEETTDDTTTAPGANDLSQTDITQTGTKAPASPKKLLISRGGPRNAGLKAALKTPAGGKSDDEVKV